MSVASILLLQQINKQLTKTKRQNTKSISNQPIIINGHIHKVDLEKRMITVKNKE